tara:strand:- start:792 stop:1358 length:567 start_codon:yes stop_codon:yes gene_type:complete
MSNSINATFKVPQGFEKKDFIQVIKKISGIDNPEKDIQEHKPPKRLSHYFLFSFLPKGQEMAVDVRWYKDDSKVNISSSSYLPIDLFVTLVKKAYSILKVPCHGNDELTLNPEIEEVGEEGIANRRIFSFNIFTPEEVEKIGETTIMKAPWEVKEKLKDGSILTQIDKESFSSSLEERKKIRKMLNHE